MTRPSPERLGLLAAILSSAFGGTAIVATRYLAGIVDPVTIGALRFGGGVLVLAPIAWALREKWPARRDWPGVLGLGLLFFAIAPVFFNAALIHTSAARGALALSTAPLLTLLVGAIFGIERPTRQKFAGVAIAMTGVAFALGAGLDRAPSGAWRGDLMMIAAAGFQAFYNVFARPYIARSGPTTFAVAGMAVGGIVLGALALVRGSDIAAFGPVQWSASAYLAVICGAAVFFLWSYALGKTPPTVVAVTVAINPISASFFGLLLLGEAVTANLVVGLVAVVAGIWIASRRKD